MAVPAEAGRPANGGAAHEICLPKRVVHDQVSGRDADDDQPVAAAAGPADRPAVQVAAGDGDAGGDLFFQGGEAGLVGEAGRDAIAGQGLDLGSRIGGVAELVDPGQVLVIPVGPGEGAGLEEGQEHGAAGGETHPPALIGGRIQLGKPGHWQRVGSARGIRRWSWQR